MSKGLGVDGLSFIDNHLEDGTVFWSGKALWVLGERHDVSYSAQHGKEATE